MMKRYITCLWLAVAVASTIVGAEQPTGRANDGKELFGNKYMCYTCHGWDGHGGSGATLSGITWNQAAFMAYVRTGGPGTPGVSGRMPSYSSKVISDQDLADVYEYVKTFTVAPAARSIPLLSNILTENDGVSTQPPSGRDK